MIRLITKEDASILSKKYNLDISYLYTLINNMTEYMYVSINNDDIDGYMICFNDGSSINIKDFKYNENNISLFLNHLSFNANKDIVFNTNDELLINNLINNNYVFDIDSLTYKKSFERIIPSNIKYYEYYEQDEEFQNLLLNQINEPLWGGAKYLYNKIITNDVKGKVYVSYDEDRKHIISFASLSDFDEIPDTEYKPWIGCVYTFRPYRGNRYSEQIIDYILYKCKENNTDTVYLSSDHIGLYEKYGFEFIKMMKTVKGEETQVFYFDTRKLDEKKRD